MPISPKTSQQPIPGRTRPSRLGAPPVQLIPPVGEEPLATAEDPSPTLAPMSGEPYAAEEPPVPASVPDGPSMEAFKALENRLESALARVEALEARFDKVADRVAELLARGAEEPSAPQEPVALPDPGDSDPLPDTPTLE